MVVLLALFILLLSLVGGGGCRLLFVFHLLHFRFVEPMVDAAICFVDSQDRVDIVANVLMDMNFDSIVALRGDSNKMERADALRKFRAGKARLLIATEVRARSTHNIVCKL